MKTFKKFILAENQKRPLKSQNDPSNWLIKTKGKPYGVLTGNYTFYNEVKVEHNNGVCVLDIDFYKKQTKEEIKQHHFILKFGSDFIKSFDTYTIKTQSGGFHLYFQYEDLPSLASGQVKKNLDMDFLNNGRYVVGPGVKINNNEYKIFNNTKIKKMSKELYNFIKDDMPKQKKQINKQKPNIDIIKTDFKTALNYDINDDVFNEIVKNTPINYFENYIDFLKFTTFCKILNRFDDWDKKAKQHQGYNYENNLKIWNNSKTNINMVDYFLKYIDKPKTYFIFKDLENLNLNIDIKPNKKILINRQKLGYDFIEDIIDEYKTNCIVVKSDTGTGKTTSVAKYLEKTQFNFCSIVSRVSLGEEQSKKVFKEDNKLENIFYKDTKGHFLDGNIVIQIESLMRVLNMDFSDHVIFLDEFNSIIEHLITSSTLDKYRTIIFKIFVKILKECHLIIATDADITPLSINFLNYIDRKPVYIENEYKHNKNVKSRELETVEKVIDKIKKYNEYFICCDSKKQAEKIHYLLEDEEIKLITSDTLEYVNLDEHKKIIISPKVIYGLDSSMKRPVFCVYRGKTISPPQMVQQIARIRNITKLYYCFPEKTVSTPIYNNYNECYNILKTGQDSNINEFNLMLNEHSIEYLKMLSTINYKNDCYNVNKFYHFKLILKQRGFVDRINFYNTNNDKTGDKKINEIIKQQKIDNIEDLTKHPLNKYLNIPADIINDYVDLFVDSFKLSQHLNIKKMFYKFNDTDQLSQYITETNRDFAVNVTKTGNNKILLLKQILKETKAQDNINPIQPIEEKKAVDIVKKYNLIYRTRRKQEPDFTQLNDIKKALNIIYKDLFNDFIKSKRKGRDQQLFFNIDNDEKEYHFKLFDINKKKIEECDIDHVAELMV